MIYAYCVKCKAKKEMRDQKSITMNDVQTNSDSGLQNKDEEVYTTTRTQ